MKNYVGGRGPPAGAFLISPATASRSLQQGPQGCESLPISPTHPSGTHHPHHHTHTPTPARAVWHTLSFPSTSSAPALTTILCLPHSLVHILPATHKAKHPIAPYQNKLCLSSFNSPPLSARNSRPSSHFPGHSSVLCPLGYSSLFLRDCCV